VLGSLYLAYDLLGGGNTDRFRTLTRGVTYGVIFRSGFMVLGARALCFGLGDWRHPRAIAFWLGSFLKLLGKRPKTWILVLDVDHECHPRIWAML